MNSVIERLRALEKLESREQSDEYQDLIAELAAVSDPVLLPQLLRSFYDDTENHEAMWALLHLVEHYPERLYVTSLIEAIPDMLPRAHDWARLLLRRVLSSDPHRALLREVYTASGPAHQQPLRDMLREVVRWNPVSAAAAAEVTGEPPP
jgi:hypothetical protein